MSNTSHIHVRPLEISDFTFVRDLASKQRNFTVPPTYVLWLMMRTKGAVCLVAEHADRGQLAYLVAVPLEGPEKSLFVWQLAASSRGGGKGATLALLTALRDFASRQHIRVIAFSMRPRSAAYRLIAQHVYKLGASAPRLVSALPRAIALNESEYKIVL